MNEPPKQRRVRGRSENFWRAEYRLRPHVDVHPDERVDDDDAHGHGGGPLKVAPPRLFLESRLHPGRHGRSLLSGARRIPTIPLLLPNAISLLPAQPTP